MLSGLGRPVSSTRLVKDLEGTKTYNYILEKAKLGDTFQSNVDVFVSIQIASLIVSISFLIIIFFGGFKGIFAIILVLFAVILAFMPIAELLTEANKRSLKITSELPEFTEILLMVASSMSVPAALSFTAERTDGILAREMRELVKILTTRAMSEKEAFSLTSSRLSTPDAKQFIAILEKGFLEGVKVVEQLYSLSDQIRRADFQRKRSYAKKLPVKLVVIFGIHFMPFLLGLAILPVIIGFTKLS